MRLIFKKNSKLRRKGSKTLFLFCSNKAFSFQIEEALKLLLICLAWGKICSFEWVLRSRAICVMRIRTRTVFPSQGSVDAGTFGHLKDPSGVREILQDGL